MEAWLLLAAQLALAGVLLFAATGKVLKSEQFAAALRLSHLPAPLIAPFRVAVPLLELCLAFALVVSTPRTLPLTLLVTTILLGIFAAWMGWVRMQHMHIICGCFGHGVAEVGPRSVVHNLLFLLLSLGGLFLTKQAQSPLPHPSLWLATLVTALAMCLAFFPAARGALPNLILTDDQIPDREADVA